MKFPGGRAAKRIVLAQGRQLKTRALRIPACVLQATGCEPAEVQTLTRQIQALRARLAG